MQSLTTTAMATATTMITSLSQDLIINIVSFLSPNEMAKLGSTCMLLGSSSHNIADITSDINQYETGILQHMSLVDIAAYRMLCPVWSSTPLYEECRRRLYRYQSFQYWWLLPIHSRYVGMSWTSLYHEFSKFVRTGTMPLNRERAPVHVLYGQRDERWMYS